MITWLAACGAPEPTVAGTFPTDPLVEPQPPPAPPSCPGDDEAATTLLVAPFVQRVGPTSAWLVWETAAGEGSRVDFGFGPDLDEVACGSVVPVFEGAAALTQVHATPLEGLHPDTTYVYQVRTGATTGPLGTFRTAPLPTTRADTHLVALGDTQRDDANPDKLREIVTESLIPWVTAEWDPELATAVDFVVIAGDLVNNGWDPAEWTHQFFGPAAPLLASVPLYPVLGNHEGNSPLYFRYFVLPDDGPQGEHWYTLDHSNVRLVGLDSNPPYDREEQLAWLEGVLDATCDDPAIDFVLAQLHHPHQSELWPAGESDWSGEVVARLERFSSDCGKVSAHLFGHTHGYSRGQSRDHDHVWVNVSSGGGALDRWGSTPQTNYPEFVDSQDTWGFVAIEATAGDDPTLRLRRVNRGHVDVPGRDETTDELVLRARNLPPQAPGSASARCDDSAPVLAAGPFQDPDPGDTHQATHWQVAPECRDLGAASGLERWRQHRDRFEDVDLQAGDDLTDEGFPELAPGDTVCWRARYRDQGLRWSAWSDDHVVTLPACE
jgi:3',5'-cyclic AMP phosphodiesterase CpdA